MSSGALDYMAHFAIASSVSFNFLVFLFQKHAVRMPGPRYQQDPYFQQLVTMHREIVARGEDHRMPDWLRL